MYFSKYEQEIKTGIDTLTNPNLNPEVTFLFSVYKPDNFIWTIHQLSKQKINNGAKIIVFQNGVPHKSEKQEEVSKICKTFGITYVHDETGYGPWGGRSKGITKLIKSEQTPTEFLATFDQDTASINPNWTQEMIDQLKSNDHLGAIYSPPIFIDINNIHKLLLYKAITLSAQKIKNLLRKPHPTGPNAFFRTRAIISSDIWEEENLNTIREHIYLKGLNSQGYQTKNLFSPKYWCLTSGNKINHIGITRYLMTVALRRTGTQKSIQRYNQMYKKRSGFSHNL